MASDSEASCVSDPNFAVICSFLEKFGASCGITSPDFLQLQEMLENTQELSQELIDIHIKLLRRIKRSVSADRWERVLIKVCHTYCSQDAWELERFGYRKARLSSKLRILKQLLEMQFDFHQKFKTEVNRLTASELRTEPIGRDKHGHAYWYQTDEHCQLRVYREDLDEETWVLVANNREGLVRLISQLASDDPNLADLVLNEDSNSLEIEKPILDTGQTSSSTSNCEAEADESSGGNEDSKDISSEPQTETSPVETSSATEDITQSEEKPKVENHLKVNKIKLTISSAAITTHKEEQLSLKPVTPASTTTKNEEKMKSEDKSEKPVGIDLSVPQTSILTPSKGVDLISKRKKSINDLAVNLRLKSRDLLYKNPVQEQEMDLSIKKPRMDPKQFSSLSVPPFEPMSIESALRMSADFAEDEEMDDEDEDEFYDEDEISLPSHMKQPRLDRPTLLGNTKKKSYSDEEEEEEYGEEIEEPVMLIHGEGSGRDCENENMIEDYSEAVEEPVMYFYGEGSGFDCDTGNTGKEEDTSSDKKSDLKDSASTTVVKSNVTESDSDLNAMKDTESASNSSSDVLTVVEEQKTEQDVVDCDFKNVKSDSVVNRSKEMSPKCQKIGTIIIDVKSGNRGQTSETISPKKSSRWDIGKPIETNSIQNVKNVDHSTENELCVDSTNTSIKNHENSDLKLLSTSKDETDNISDISVTDVETSVNKLKDCDKTKLKNQNIETAYTAVNTHEALTDHKMSDSDEKKKQPMFFFGPGCFKFKAPMTPSPHSSKIKDLNTKGAEAAHSSLKLQNKSDQKKTNTEKLSLLSDRVPTQNKADILIDNKEQATVMKTNLSSEITTTARDTKIKDIIKENISENKSFEDTLKCNLLKNVEITKKVAGIKEKTCKPDSDVKSIHNSEPLSTENVEDNDKEICKSESNSKVVQLKSQAEITNLVRVDNTDVLCNKTSTENKNKIIDTKIVPSESVSTESLQINLESSISKQDDIDLPESKKPSSENIEESKVYISDITEDQDRSETENVTDTGTADHSKSVIINNRLDLTKNIETDQNTEKETSTEELSTSFRTETDVNITETTSSHNLTKLLSTNIDSNETTVTCTETKESIHCQEEKIAATEKSSESPILVKETEEMTDEKSETLSETLDSLTTLIDNKSDESDDQSSTIKNDQSSTLDSAQISETNLHPIEEKCFENDAVTVKENASITPREQTLTAEENISVPEKSNQVTSNTENETVTSVEEMSITNEDQILESVENTNIQNESEKKTSITSESTNNIILETNTEIKEKTVTDASSEFNEEGSVKSEDIISESTDNEIISTVEISDEKENTDNKHVEDMSSETSNKEISSINAEENTEASSSAIHEEIDECFITKEEKVQSSSEPEINTEVSEAVTNEETISNTFSVVENITKSDADTNETIEDINVNVQNSSSNVVSESNETLNTEISDAGVANSCDISKLDEVKLNSEISDYSVSNREKDKEEAKNENITIQTTSINSQILHCVAEESKEELPVSEIVEHNTIPLESELKDVENIETIQEEATITDSAAESKIRENNSVTTDESTINVTDKTKFTDIKIAEEIETADSKSVSVCQENNASLPETTVEGITIKMREENETTVDNTEFTNEPSKLESTSSEQTQNTYIKFSTVLNENDSKIENSDSKLEAEVHESIGEINNTENNDVAKSIIKNIDTNSETNRIDAEVQKSSVETNEVENRNDKNLEIDNIDNKSIIETEAKENAVDTDCVIDEIRIDTNKGIDEVKINDNVESISQMETIEISRNKNESVEMQDSNVTDTQIEEKNTKIIRTVPETENIEMQDLIENTTSITDTAQIEENNTKNLKTVAVTENTEIQDSLVNTTNITDTAQLEENNTNIKTVPVMDNTEMQDSITNTSITNTSQMEENNTNIIKKVSVMEHTEMKDSLKNTSITDTPQMEENNTKNIRTVPVTKNTELRDSIQSVTTITDTAQIEENNTNIIKTVPVTENTEMRDSIQNTSITDNAQKEESNTKIIKTIAITENIKIQDSLENTTSITDTAEIEQDNTNIIETVPVMENTEMQDSVKNKNITDTTQIEENNTKIKKILPVTENISQHESLNVPSVEDKVEFCNSELKANLVEVSEKEIKNPVENLSPSSEDKTSIELSDNKLEVNSGNEPTKTTKEKILQEKELLPCKDDITCIKDSSTDLNLDTSTDNAKHKFKAPILNETVGSIHNTEEEKKHSKIDTQLVEVNHVIAENSIEHWKASVENIGKTVLKQSKTHIEKDTYVKQDIMEKKDKEKPVSENVTDVPEQLVVEVNIPKTNERKTVKANEAKEPPVGKVTKDKKSIDDIKNQDKTVAEIIDNSHDSEKIINISDNKDSKYNSAFDKLTEVGNNLTVTESGSKKVQKDITPNTEVMHSNEADKDSSDDDIMDSCDFEQGNDYKDDSDNEEKDNISKKIEVNKEKLNNTEIKIQGTKSKIMLKDINTLIDDKNKMLRDNPLKTKIIVKKVDIDKNKSDNISKIGPKSKKLENSGLVDKVGKTNEKVTDNLLQRKSKMKLRDVKVSKKLPILTCVDITKLQAKTPPKLENRTIVNLKQQSNISSPRSLVSFGVDNDDSSDVIDVPETDPLALPEEEILMSKKLEAESVKNKPKGLSLATFKLDDTEDADTSALIPEPIARALRNRKISIVAANVTRKRSTDNVADGSGGKKRRGRRGRPPGNVGNRVIEIKDDSSSDEDNENPPKLEVKVTTPQRGTGKARRGRGRGRGRGAAAAYIERVVNDSPVLSSDPLSETSRAEVTASPAEQKTPTSRKKRRVLGLDIDPNVIIQPEGNKDTEELITRSSVRQSRRIAQIKIKEQAERRKIDDLTHVDVEHKKKKKKDYDKDFKIDKKKKKHKEISEDEEESEDEVIEISSKRKHKKRKHQDLRKLFNTSNPWQSSSESSTNEEEEEEEVEEEPSDEEPTVLKSDHEFSPESDLENNAEVQPMRRARTVKKESDTEDPTDEHACQKCGKADHPEWILLCDKCDCGWHCSCLRPALLVIPEGDWFCPPCQHITLVEALKTQLIDYDKKINRREMEVRRKQRLAYVGISLDNVLPSKETEGPKREADNDQNEAGSGEESSDSESDSESGSSSGDESEPIYQLRQRRQAHSYRFNDYDELINSAIQDEMESVKGAGNQGRGKDIATIVNAEKEEAKALLEQQQNIQEPVVEQPPPVVPEYEAKPEREPDESDNSSDDDRPRVVPKHSGRKKHRKLNSLDISSEDDAADDEDFKGTSASEEEDGEDLGSEDSEEFEFGRRGKGRSGPTRRSTRARMTRFDKDFINDDSEDEAPKRKKTKSIWDESESEESDKSWGKKKKSKKQRQFPTPKSSKKSRKKKRRSNDSDPDVKRPKKPKIKYGGLDDTDDEEYQTRRTRGRKINYIDVLGSDSDEDKPRKTAKPIESEDEYVANEEDDDPEEALGAVEDEGKDSDSDSVDNRPPIQRKIIKIIAPSKVAKGRGKAGIPRPQHLKQVTPPPPPSPLPPPPPEVIQQPEPLEETPDVEDEEEEEEESDPPVPVDIPVIAANPDDLNEEEVGTMMMENEEYAKKQLELMAIQLAKDKKKKEKEAKKLVEKKEVVMPPIVAAIPTTPSPTQPKKRGRKSKSELEAIAAAKAAQEALALSVPSVTTNPALVQPPIQYTDSVDKTLSPNPDMNLIPSTEIPTTVPTVVSDLSNSPPKRRGRGKGKKTLAAEAAAQPSQETVTAPTIIPPPAASVLNTTTNPPNLNTMPNINIPTSTQNDPQNLSPNQNLHVGKLGIAAPPQPFSQNQPTPSVITRMLQSQPISAQTFTTSANAMNQKYFPPGIPPEQQPSRGSPSGQFPPVAGRGRVPSPYRQSPPAMGMYPGVRPMASNSPHRLRSPGPSNLQMFHSTHHSMDPSPSGGGPINIAPTNRDRNSPANVGSPLTSKEGPTPPPPPPYSRAMTANRFSPNETTPGPSLPAPVRHHMFPQAGAHMQQPSPPPRPTPPGNFSPYHPPPPPNYHYGAYPPAPSLAAADDALPPTDYQGSPYPEQYNTAEGTVHSSEGSNSKPFDEEGSGEFGGLVSYFSSQREDDLDT